MLVPATTMPIALDVTTLFLVATCVTGLLGLLLLFAFAKTRIPALAWWGAAYLIGGGSGAARGPGGVISPSMPAGGAHAPFFIARRPLWDAPPGVFRPPGPPRAPLR